MTSVVEFTYDDIFEVEGTVVSGDREGDTSEPGLSRVIPDYVEEFHVYVADIDVTEYMGQWVLDRIEQRLIDPARED